MGIYAFFLGFGLFQEAIFNTPDVEGEKFRYPCFVVGLISIGNVLVALSKSAVAVTCSCLRR